MPSQDRDPPMFRDGLMLSSPPRHGCRGHRPCSGQLFSQTANVESPCARCRRQHRHPKGGYRRSMGALPSSPTREHPGVDAPAPSLWWVALRVCTQAFSPLPPPAHQSCPWSSEWTDMISEAHPWGAVKALFLVQVAFPHRSIPCSPPAAVPGSPHSFRKQPPCQLRLYSGS